MAAAGLCAGSRRGQSGHRRPRPGSGHAHVSGHSARRGEGRQRCVVLAARATVAISRARSRWGGARTLGETRWRCGGPGAREVRVGRARQGRRCLAAVGLTIARRLPRADTRPTGMFLSYPDGGGARPVWGAVQRRGLCRPPCPALLHGRTSRSRWHGGHEIWADAFRVRRAGWPWATVLWVRAVAGGRQTQASRPQPAADTLPERHHATAPGHPAPRVRRRVVRAVRGWEMAIQVGKHWRAGAGHGGGGMARAQGRMAGAGWRALSGVATGREERGRHQHPAPLIAPPTARAPNPNLAEDRNTSTVPACISAQAGARPGPIPVWRRRLARGRGRSEQRARRAQDGVAFCGTGWHWMALDGIGWHWMAFWRGEVGPSLQFTLSWCARPLPRTTPVARARSSSSPSLSPVFPPHSSFLSLPLPSTPAHLCPFTPAHPFLPTRSHHTPHLRSVCCEVLSASKDCGCPGCDGILGACKTDPQAGRLRWWWPFSAVSRDGLLWWSEGSADTASVLVSSSVSGVQFACAVTRVAIAPMSEKIGVSGGRDGTAGACAGCGV